ncbi:MAG: ROK family protein [Spirochaetales bacterium]|nr:ROK family protein [Spirochaetales bacterium]
MRIGFDLGGTKMLAAVLDGDDGIVARCKTRTVGGDNESVYRQIVETIQCALDKAKIGRDRLEAVGIAVPGPIDLDRGVVLDTPNVGISNFPLVDRLSEELGCVVLLENDVNAGLWGEYVAGAAKGMRHVVGIFPGTGIGGGLILDGKLYRGKSGAAGEIGHITVQTDGRRCGCGNHGCLETVASKTAIARDLALLAMNGQSKVLAEAGATDIRLIKSGLIAKALEAGEPAVVAVVSQAARFLGVGMAAIVNTFDPEMVVVGGGLVEKVGSHITDIAVSTMRERAMPRIIADVAVATAALGDDAGVVGAADLTRR